MGKSYFFILAGNLFLYFISWFYNEIRTESICVGVRSPWNRILDITGKKDEFAVAGIIIESAAHINLIIVYGILFIQRVILHNQVVMKSVNRAWLTGAFGLISITQAIEEFLQAKKCDKLGLKLQYIILAIFFIGFGIYMFVLSGITINFVSQGVEVE